MNAERFSSAVLALFSLALLPAGQSQSVAVVSHVKVLSDKVEDVSSLEAWTRSFIKEGMSDKEKALAIWQSVVKFQHQDVPPREYLQTENSVLDPIKMFNVYGYSYCSVASANVQALARYAGLPARGWTLNAHVVPEISWDGAWHLLDASLIDYFPKSDGTLAGVEEIAANLKQWYGAHPGLKGSDAKLRQFMSGGGWKNGPEALAKCPFYDANGWLPAATHGWYSTMQEYDGSTLFPFEAGYSLGYQVNIQLRRGERLTRNWSNQGLHVNLDKGDAPGCLKGRVGQDPLRYTPQFGDLAPGRVGNGTLEYDAPLAASHFRDALLSAENLAGESDDGKHPALHVKDTSQPGTFVLRMPSSYVYLSGVLTVKPVMGSGGQITVFFSDNNGLDWKPIADFTASGEQRVDLKPLVLRRYDYRLKFVLRGRDTGLDALRLVHDIQHSQRPLPALDHGSNDITFTVGPSEGTISIEGSTDLKNKGRQLVFTDFHPETKGLAKDKILLAGGTGEITFPVETPGEMTRLRLSAFYRARDARDAWEVQVSFDGGQSFKTVERLSGPTVSFGKYVVVPDVPPATKRALVRFAGTQRNTTMISNFRLDADYQEPHGGFLPVKVTWLWEENGQPKKEVRVARQPEEKDTIHCAAKPVMKSIVLELAE